MSITPVLAEWIAESPPLATGRALELARDAMVDITGCMVAGAADPAVAAALRAVGDLGAGPASVVGTDVALTAPHAALVNGTAAHALDFDDNYHGNMGHATAVLAPALLALAEERRAGGAAVLDAYIAGLEAMLVVGDAETVLVVSGNGDVIEPDDGIAAIGSGGSYALAAARALARRTELGAEAIAREALGIAAEICIYTNDSISLVSLP